MSVYVVSKTQFISHIEILVIKRSCKSKKIDFFQIFTKTFFLVLEYNYTRTFYIFNHLKVLALNIYTFVHL